MTLKWLALTDILFALHIKEFILSQSLLMAGRVRKKRPYLLTTNFLNTISRETRLKAAISSRRYPSLDLPFFLIWRIWRVFPSLLSPLAHLALCIPNSLFWYEQSRALLPPSPSFCPKKQKLLIAARCFVDFFTMTYSWFRVLSNLLHSSINNFTAPRQKFALKTLPLSKPSAGPHSLAVRKQLCRGIRSLLLMKIALSRKGIA